MIDILKSMNISPSSVRPFKSVEDASEYEAWLISDGEDKYVLKKAKGDELVIYRTFFSEPVAGAPRFIKSAKAEDGDYFLMEYFKGQDLCKCNRKSLMRALDALIAIQEKYWNSEPLFYEKALESRRNRGKYLFDTDLEEAYSRFLAEFEALPRTLCHDDLLPFNILVADKGAALIDWEVAGVLPYPTSLARLIAHTENDPEYLFYMSDDDRAFAVDYYYDNLVKGKGISYSDYRRSLDLFLFYEYCEWIMVGNKYENAKGELFEKYTVKAKKHIKK